MFTATKEADVEQPRVWSARTAGIAQGRNIFLKELGLEPRYVAAADPALQTDVVPDGEPLTHLPSPWH